MAEEKAGLLLRLSPQVKKGLERCARHNLRSANKQAEAILRKYLNEHGFMKGDDDADE